MSGPSTHRLTQVFLAGVIAVAAIGFVVGIDHGAPKRQLDLASTTPHAAETAPLQPRRSDVEHSSVTSRRDRHVPEAVSYDDLGLLGPAALNGNRYTVADLGVPNLTRLEPIAVDTAAKPASLLRRAAHRAFDGAPPTIPHATDQMTDGACVACHATGLAVAENPAPIMPHSHYANCQQCHIADSPLFEERTLTENKFVGLASAGEGPRAWTGAPPEMPHSTWMRENCQSCHGPLGQPGLRTSHPERANCLQCHARPQQFDPREPTTAAALFRAPTEFLESADGEKRSSGSGPATSSNPKKFSSPGTDTPRAETR